MQFTPECRASRKSSLNTDRIDRLYTDWNVFKGNIDKRYDLRYEKVAASAFRQEMKVKHFNFKLRDCGPMVSKTHKYLGASIDYIVSCDFHPERLMEMGLMSLSTL